MYPEPWNQSAIKWEALNLMASILSSFLKTSFLSALCYVSSVPSASSVIAEIFLGLSSTASLISFIDFFEFVDFVCPRVPGSFIAKLYPRILLQNNIALLQKQKTAILNK